MIVPIPRKLNPGVNHITASVRATFGTAHQVMMNSQYRFFFLQVGMGSSKHQLQDKKKCVMEVIESYLRCNIHYLTRLETLKLRRWWEAGAGIMLTTALCL